MIKNFFSLHKEKNKKEKNKAESQKLLRDKEFEIYSKLEQIKYAKERSCSMDYDVRRYGLDELKILEEEHEMLLEEWGELDGTISLYRHKNSHVREIKRENLNFKKREQKLKWELKRLEDKLWHFEDKVGRKKWVNDLRDRVLMVEKWRYDLIYNKSSNKEIDLLQELKDNVKGDKRPILDGIIIRLNLSQEIEKLKQDLVNQTANNIILKDELNKLKKINN